jgi:DNA-directed RNA polymerase subunit RPC12/RpoP
MIDLEDLKRPPHEFPAYGRASFGSLVGCPDCGFRIPYRVKAGATSFSLFAEPETDDVECPACKTTFDAAANIYRDA